MPTCCLKDSKVDAREEAFCPFCGMRLRSSDEHIGLYATFEARDMSQIARPQQLGSIAGFENAKSGTTSVTGVDTTQFQWPCIPLNKDVYLQRLNQFFVSDDQITLGKGLCKHRQITIR